MRLLAIGASDCSGRTGLTQYCRVGHLLGVEVSPVAACVVAAEASGEEARGIVAIAPSMIAKQIDVSTNRANPDRQACVVGMLARHQAVNVVIERIKRREIRHVVFHPVTGSSGSRQLLTGPGVKLTRKFLSPLCELIVTTAASLSELSGRPVSNWKEAERAANVLRDLGAPSILALDLRVGENRLDALFGQDAERFERVNRVGMTRGECDRVASGIAIKLMQGMDVRTAIEEIHKMRLGSG